MNSLVTPGPQPASVAPAQAPDVRPAQPRMHLSMLGWPAWARLLAMMPVIALLWLAVAWAQLEVAPW